MTTVTTESHHLIKRFTLAELNLKRLELISSDIIKIMCVTYSTSPQPPHNLGPIGFANEDSIGTQKKALQL